MITKRNYGHVLPLAERILAPNIGLIEVGGEGDDDFLVGAFINGVLIGDTTITAVESITHVSKPPMPRIYQNYPNPFNTMTRISYLTPDNWAKPLELSIFDILGREIYSFNVNRYAFGYSEIVWDGHDNLGAEVGSGQYFLRMRTGDYLQSTKITLLK